MFIFLCCLVIAVPHRCRRALENGDTKTGITIFEIVKNMDAGDIWAQKEMDILPGDTRLPCGANE